MRSTFKVLFYTKNQSVKNGKAPIMGPQSMEPKRVSAVKERCPFPYGT